MDNLVQALLKNKDNPHISIKLMHKGLFKQDNPFLDIRIHASINPNDYDKIQQQLKGDNQ